MDNLQELDLKYRYRSSTDDFVKDFFEPCLSMAKSYKRAAGFFSSSSLHSIHKGLIPLLKNGGQIELVVSPVLSEKDIIAIEYGESLKDVAFESVERSINELEWGVEIETLAWLIASEKLQMKFACSKRGGMYHEKMGIIKDSSDDYITFSGSLNESETALNFNFEFFNVEKSWKDDREGAIDTKENFNKLWNNETKGLEVYNISDAIKNKILMKRKYTKVEDFIKTETFIEAKNTAIKCNISKLYNHQREAIDAWFLNEFKGIWAMCTGAGKTITAMKCIVELQDKLLAESQEKRLNAVVIVCPKITLVDQWAENIRKYLPRLLVIKLHNQSEDDMGSLRRGLMNTDKSQPQVIITTFITGFSNEFIGHLNRAVRIKQNILFIADEMHGLGSKSYINKLNGLSDAYKYRIGLSATPEIEGNQGSTDFLDDYFGNIISTYDLKKAIDDKVLCPYLYYPIPIFLNEEKSSEYCKILTDIEGDSSNLSLYEEKRKFLRNSDIYSKTIEDLIGQIGVSNFKHTLVFCPPGKNDSEDEERTLAKVKSLFSENNIISSSITAKTTGSKDILNKFSSGDFKVLFSIGCLDEGMDIPSTEIAIMLYSIDRERQFIQRRGRVLRKSKGKKCAMIYDLITLPQGLDISDDKKERIFQKEMRRYSEFAEWADNTEEAAGILSEAYNKL